MQGDEPAQRGVGPAPARPLDAARAPTYRGARSLIGSASHQEEKSLSGVKRRRAGGGGAGSWDGVRTLGSEGGGMGKLQLVALSMHGLASPQSGPDRLRWMQVFSPSPAMLEPVHSSTSATTQVVLFLSETVHSHNKYITPLSSMCSAWRK